MLSGIVENISGYNLNNGEMLRKVTCYDLEFLE